MNDPLLALRRPCREILLSLFLILAMGNCMAALDDFSEQSFIGDVPVVLSASRLRQTLSEAPNAMTVIDRTMIKTSGFRTIPDLLKLVPGMYVSYYKGNLAIVAYHGATDAASRRMQVMIDGRSVYLPPNNMVDWANLPITIDDIERIEVIRGPAAASYGANSAQGVINIITVDAGGMAGKSVSVTHGTKGINDATVHFGHRSEMFDYRMSLGYTADNGYDNLGTNPNAIPPSNTSLLNNSNDSHQARLANYRGNYHPNMADNFDLQLGFNHGVQGNGFSDKNPTPSNPAGTNGNPFHDVISNSSFMQLGWTRLLENSSEFSLRYYHIQQNQHETLPVYLFGVYFPNSVAKTMATVRDQIEAQHTVSISTSNRLVYGANYQKNSVDWQSLMSPLSLYIKSSSTTENIQMFANDEWRMSPRLLLNIGGLFEKEDAGHKNLSPRASLSFHLTPQHTFRTGISVAYRAPALNESNYPLISPGALITPWPTTTSPNLMPEKLVSREIGYIEKFPEQESQLDLRLYSDTFSNGIFWDNAASRFVNKLSAEYHGLEATLKKSWDDSSNMTVNFSHAQASSNGPALAAAGDTYLASAAPWTNDFLSASVPKDSASLLYSMRLHGSYSLSASYYFQGALQPADRSAIDYQPAQHRVDVRIARTFHGFGSVKGEVAGVVQNLFQTDYTEYLATGLFNRRAFITLTFRQ